MSGEAVYELWEETTESRKDQVIKRFSNPVFNV